ncbi:transcription antitermination factor NusB [Sphingoaurantiacus capsulatus]|uniref:Transcription antitermination protein NusB n=1 Tax=Sphingoaurantiacus capsulatus TaxID=1771310 RepID=A0ABV7X978_9SPHN
MASPSKKPRSGNARSAARLAAVQALYQREMSGAAVPLLLSEFHQHRLGAEIEGDQFREADVDFFNDVVKGVDARLAEIDAMLGENLAEGWTLDRLDRPMRQIVRAGAYELVARADIPTAAIINEYVDVAHAFYEAREAKFVNGLLDSIAKKARG